MRTALIQMRVTTEKRRNLEIARQRLREARENGADIAVLPEMFCCPYDNACFRAYGETAGGEAQRMLSDAARELGIYVVGGSLPELEGEAVYNASFVYGPSGELLARHRKVHLFDIDVEGGQRFRESDTLSPGDQITTFETSFGTMGLCICFDLRFEELARCMTLRGAKVLFVPAAFNMTTGPAHWELLFRQRAVDNQCFTVDVSPARDPGAGYVAYGNSLAVDPWGTVLCRAEGMETVLYADLDLSRVESVRRQLPILSARRTDLYELRELSKQDSGHS
jgi:Predicted amidohydrolase